VEDPAPQIPALAFSFASCPRAGPEVGELVFLIPALADDHNEPNASPPAPGLDAAGDLIEELADIGFAWFAGAGTEVK